MAKKKKSMAQKFPKMAKKDPSRTSAPKKSGPKKRTSLASRAKQGYKKAEDRITSQINTSDDRRSAGGALQRIGRSTNQPKLVKQGTKMKKRGLRQGKAQETRLGRTYDGAVNLGMGNYRRSGLKTGQRNSGPVLRAPIRRK